MGKKSASLSLISFLFLLLLFFPLESQSKFYGYVDKDGNRHFVDNIEKIPPEYKGSVTVYKEKYDDLSEKERAIMLEKERQEQEEARKEREQEYKKWESEQDEWEKKLKELEMKRKAERERMRGEREKRSKEREMKRKGVQKVIIRSDPIAGDSVFVPVVLGYRGREIETLLKLDTGASIIALHREVADELNINLNLFRKIKAKVAGGTLINTHIGRLNYVKVGPIKKENINVGIIDHQGPTVQFKGLLGMNFLRGLEYSIDFKNQVIRWNP